MQATVSHRAVTTSMAASTQQPRMRPAPHMGSPTRLDGDTATNAVLPAGG